MEPDQLYALGALPFVVALVQLEKNTFPDSPAWTPVATALVSAQLITAAFTSLQHGNFVLGALMGLATGLSAMGAWSGVKTIVTDKNKSISEAHPPKSTKV